MIYVYLTFIAPDMIWIATVETRAMFARPMFRCRCFSVRRNHKARCRYLWISGDTFSLRVAFKPVAREIRVFWVIGRENSTKLFLFLYSLHSLTFPKRIGFHHQHVHEKKWTVRWFREFELQKLFRVCQKVFNHRKEGKMYESLCEHSVNNWSWLWIEKLIWNASSEIGQADRQQQSWRSYEKV